MYKRERDRLIEKFEKMPDNHPNKAKLLEFVRKQNVTTDEMIQRAMKNVDSHGKKK